MAGGLIFMGVIASMMGVAQAMVVHGAVQSVSNGSRAFMLREHIRWDILARMAIGALPAIAALSAIAFVPSKPVLFIILGLLPALLWLPRGWIAFDARRPRDAMLCGALVMGLILSAGVAGPALDMFFIKTSLRREQVVATKAVAMFSSHIVKIIYFGMALITASGLTSLPPAWFFIAAAPCIITGTYVGTRILKRMSDISFRQYTKWLVSIIGVVYLLRGIGMA
jgi:uncharacterized membrane protein YfcA